MESPADYNTPVIITIGAELKAEKLPEDVMKHAVQELTFTNPRYEADMQQGRHWTEEPATLSAYRHDGHALHVPRGYAYRFVEVCRMFDLKYEVTNKTLTLKAVTFDNRIQLKDYQAEAVDKLVKAKQGGLCSPCGSGKTVMMLEAVARIGQPALWITHTKELMYQAMDRAEEFLQVPRDEIGTIQDGKVDIGARLTVALIQTLNRRMDEDIKNRFGCIIVDEAHHLAAATFYNTVNHFPALYRLWATATPEREDGLSGMIYFTGGRIVHEIHQRDIDTVMVPDLKVIRTGFKTYEDDYAPALKDLTTDVKRNSLILDHIKAEAVPGNYLLVLSDRIGHLEILKGMIEKAMPSKKVEILTGKLPKKKRLEIMERVQNREIVILLATQLAREGLDILHLNRLILATPKKAAGATQQEVGRIMRQSAGKRDCKVIDFWDKDTLFAGQFWKRRKVYLDLGMDAHRF